MAGRSQETAVRSQRSDVRSQETENRKLGREVTEVGRRPPGAPFRSSNSDGTAVRPTYLKCSAGVLAVRGWS